jgi:NADH-quinone oxidoreductase subunit K
MVGFNALQFLVFSASFFLFGICGIFALRKNLILVLVSIELMLLSVNFNFIIFSIYLDDLLGQLFALLILTVAAAESAIGLAILVAFYRLRGIIATDYINSLKGLFSF